MDADDTLRHPSEQSGYDSAIDRELQQLLAVDPSPRFAAAVRERIDADAVRRGTFSNLSSWLLPAAGLAAAAVFVVALLNGPHDTAPVASQAGPLLPAPAAPVVTTGLPPASDVRADAHPRGAAASKRTRPVEPETVLPEEELRGMRVLLTLARQGDPNVARLLEPSPESVPNTDSQPPELVVAPLAIEPLTLADAETN